MVEFAIRRAQHSTEEDHELVRMDRDEVISQLFLDHQVWEAEQVFRKILGDGESGGSNFG